MTLPPLWASSLNFVAWLPLHQFILLDSSNENQMLNVWTLLATNEIFHFIEHTVCSQFQIAWNVAQFATDRTLSSIAPQITVDKVIIDTGQSAVWIGATGWKCWPESNRLHSNRNGSSDDCKATSEQFRQFGIDQRPEEWQWQSSDGKFAGLGEFWWNDELLLYLYSFPLPALQIFCNLNTLSKCVSNTLTTFVNDIKHSIKECFAGTDVASSLGSRKPAKESKDGRVGAPRGPGKTPTLTTSQNFRSKLWTALEWLFDEEIFGYCNQVLYRV